MRKVFLSLVLGTIALTPVCVSAQGQSEAPAQAALDGDSPIEAIAATPEGKKALDDNIPELLSHPAYEQFKSMSLRAVAPFSEGIITSEKIAAVEASLGAEAPDQVDHADMAILDGNSPIEAVAASPAGRKAIETYLPEVLSHPAYNQFKSMSLRTVAPLSGGLVTEEKIASIEASLKAGE